MEIDSHLALRTRRIRTLQVIQQSWWIYSRIYVLSYLKIIVCYVMILTFCFVITVMHPSFVFPVPGYPGNRGPLDNNSAGDLGMLIYPCQWKTCTGLWPRAWRQSLGPWIWLTILFIVLPWYGAESMVSDSASQVALPCPAGKSADISRGFVSFKGMSVEAVLPSTWGMEMQMLGALSSLSR